MEYRSLIDTLSLGVFHATLGPDSRMIDVNPAFVRIFGFENKEELLLRNLSDLFDDQEKIKEYGRKLLKGEYIINETDTFTRKDGTKFIGSVSAVPVKDRAGRVLHCEGILEDVTEHMQMITEIRQSANRFRLLFNRVFDAIILVDKQLCVVDVNDAACTIYGYSREEFQKLSLEDIHPADVFPEHSERTRGVFKTDRAYVKEIGLLTKSGEVIDAEGGAVLIDMEGQEYILGSFRDITEKKKAERALRESEEKYRSMMEAMHDPVYICSPDLLVTYMNPAMIRRVGREAIGEPCFKAINNLSERCPWCVPDKVQHGEDVQTEIISPLDGLSYHVSHSPIFHVDGSISKMTIYRDITQEKRSQQALQNAFSEIKRLKERIEVDYTYLREEIKSESNFESIVGRSNALRIVLSQVEQVAPTDTTVLILGETGTGKELMARAVHDFSCRKDRPLVKVNCAALPSNLIESELFGHERGAFTGAVTMRKGRFEVADGGTIFLDEIGELPLELQTKLLRVIEYGEFERLGSWRTIKVDVRIIAATNRDLIKECREGRFRQDLYFRLNVFPVILPPLRDRKEDIPLILNVLIGRLNKKMGKRIERIPTEIAKALQDYAWPGNIRELQNIIERAVINTKGSVLRLSDRLEAQESPGSSGGQSGSHQKSLTEVEGDHILHTLIEKKWRIEGPKGAASALKLKPSTLRSRMEKLGIKKPLR